MKWALLIIMCVIAAMWIVYMALRAINGIVYEVDLIQINLRRYSKPDDDAEDEQK